MGATPHDDGAPSGPTSIRAFVALRLGPELVEPVRHLQNQLRTRLPQRAVRWTHPRQWHLTLRFLGQVRAQDLVPLRETLRQACAGEPALTLGLAGLGVFPDARNPRVLWLGVTRDLETLAKIHSHVVAATTGLGEPEEARDFHPHLTLARLSIAPSEARLVTRALASVRGELPGEWEVNSVELVRSELRPEGARYSRLELFPLGNATSRVATGR